MSRNLFSLAGLVPRDDELLLVVGAQLGALGARQL